MKYKNIKWEKTTQKNCPQKNYVVVEAKLNHKNWISANKL